MKGLIEIGVITKLFQFMAIIFMVFPLVVVSLTSIDPRGLTGNLLLPGVTGRWYVSFFAFEPFLSGIYNSILLASCASILAIALSMPASLVLARKRSKAADFLNTLFLSPVVVPGVVTGSALLFFFFSHGMRDSFTNLAIAHTVITVPYAVRMLTSSLIGLDISVEEAAMNLGANELTTFIRITLPSLKPGIAASVIFTLATSFQNVDTSVFLTTGLPLFPTALLSYLRGNFDPTIAAGSTLVITASFLMIFALDRAVGLKKAIF